MPQQARHALSSYRVRIAIGYVALVALLAGAWGWSLYGPLDRAVLEQQRSHVASVARAGAVVLAESDDPLPMTARRLVADTDLRVTVVRRDGVVLFDTQEDAFAMANHGGRPEIQAALGGRMGSDSRRSVTQGTRQLYVAVPATVDGEPVALRFSESLERVRSLGDSSRRSGLLLLVVAAVVALLVASKLTTYATAPILRLTGAATAMAEGRLDMDVSSERGELGVLAEALSDLRRQMRARLDDLEGRERDLRTVLDGLRDAVFLVDGMTITLANRSAGEMFKAPLGGWKGRDITEEVLPGSLTGALSRALASAEETYSEDVGPDPTQRYLRLTTARLGAVDGGERLLVVVHDITDRMRLDQVRRDFVANASHELKTPTAGIQLLADSATTAAEDGDTDQALVFVGQIKDEADRLRRLVLDLLDLSRLEAASAPGAVTDLREAVQLAIMSHGRAAARKGLALSSEAEAVAGEDVFAAADPTDVAVALDNLLDNAIAYTESGSVTVRLGALGDSTSVTVTDTGVGIPAEDIPRVFERFYRVDRSRDRRSGGTGLGLSLVRHVVERSGGEVSISSQPGSGTSVTLRLTRAR